MARKTYDATIRAAILETAGAARKEGKSWNDAFEAAKAVGYTGTVRGIAELMRGSEPKSADEAPAEATPAAAAEGSTPAALEAPPAPKKRGRPAGVKSKPAEPATRERHRYNDVEKAAIIQAAVDSRKSGQKWSGAHEAAKVAGYQGGIPALMLLVSKAGQTPKKRGRPAKVKPGPKPKSPAAPLSASYFGLEQIEQTINREVQSRINAVVDEAIAKLQSMKA